MNRARQHSVPQMFFQQESQLHQRHQSCPGELSPRDSPYLQLPMGTSVPHDRHLSASAASPLQTMTEGQPHAGLVATASLPAIPFVPSYMVPSSQPYTPPVQRRTFHHPASQGMLRSQSLQTDFSTASRSAFVIPPRSASSSGLDDMVTEQMPLPADLSLVREFYLLVLSFV